MQAIAFERPGPPTQALNTAGRLVREACGEMVLVS